MYQTRGTEPDGEPRRCPPAARELVWGRPGQGRPRAVSPAKTTGQLFICRSVIHTLGSIRKPPLYRYCNCLATFISSYL